MENNEAVVETNQTPQPVTPTPAKSTHIEMDAKELKMVRLGHLGTIFSNMAIFLAVIALVGAFGSVISILVPIVSGLIMVIMFMGILSTVGAVLVMFPGYWDALQAVGNFSGESAGIGTVIVENLLKVAPFLIIAAIIASVLAIVLLSMDKTAPHKKRIISSSVIIGVVIVALIIIVIGGMTVQWDN